MLGLTSGVTGTNAVVRRVMTSWGPEGGFRLDPWYVTAQAPQTFRVRVRVRFTGTVTVTVTVMVTVTNTVTVMVTAMVTVTVTFTLRL